MYHANDNQYLRRRHVKWPICGPFQHPADASRTGRRQAAVLDVEPPRLERRKPIHLPPVKPAPDEEMIQSNTIDIHPLLAVPPANIIYDVRLPPSSLCLSASSSWHFHTSSALYGPVTPACPSIVRLISRSFPWTVDVHANAQSSRLQTTSGFWPARRDGSQLNGLGNLE